MPSTARRLASGRGGSPDRQRQSGPRRAGKRAPPIYQVGVRRRQGATKAPWGEDSPGGLSTAVSGSFLRVKFLRPKTPWQFMNRKLIRNVLDFRLHRTVPRKWQFVTSSKGL